MLEVKGLHCQHRFDRAFVQLNYTLDMPCRRGLHCRSRLPLLIAALASGSLLAQVPTFAISGDWDVLVSVPGAGSQTVHVPPPVMVRVTAEKYVAIPMFNPKAGGWVKGAQLLGVKAQETTSPQLLDTGSFTLRAGPESDAAIFTQGVDYEIDLSWGTFGRLADSRIQPDQAVFASYRHAQMRLDAVVLSADGRIVVRQGEPRAAAPVAPQVSAGERHLGNIYLPGFVTKLQPEHLFPILEQAYPEPPKSDNATVARLVRLLNSGRTLRILAWGDSVTDGAYLPEKNTQRWQEQFVARLRERFPRANIELTTQAWGGRNTGSYLAEPAGSPHNYRETVLAREAGLDHLRVRERRKSQPCPGGGALCQAAGRFPSHRGRMDHTHAALRSPRLDGANRRA